MTYWYLISVLCSDFVYNVCNTPDTYIFTRRHRAGGVERKGEGEGDKENVLCHRVLQSNWFLLLYLFNFFVNNIMIKWHDDLNDVILCMIIIRLYQFSIFQPHFLLMPTMNDFLTKTSNWVKYYSTRFLNHACCYTYSGIKWCCINYIIKS
jgi:hypothetical protein